MKSRLYVCKAEESNNLPEKSFAIFFNILIRSILLNKYLLGFSVDLSGTSPVKKLSLESVIKTDFKVAEKPEQESAFELLTPRKFQKLFEEISVKLDSEIKLLVDEIVEKNRNKLNLATDRIKNYFDVERRELEKKIGYGSQDERMLKHFEMEKKIIKEERWKYSKGSVYVTAEPLLYLLLIQ